MLDLLTCRSILIAVLVGTVASAKERVPQLRNVTFPHRPDQVACPVYVAGEIATVLHFEQNVDPARTKLEGWEGRFEPLGVAGQSVVIMPLHDLTPEDRLPLVVTLVDGTQVPITVTADKDNVDHQVNLVWDPETMKYLRANLENALWREDLYRKENERYERERKSHRDGCVLRKREGSGRDQGQEPPGSILESESGPPHVRNRLLATLQQDARVCGQDGAQFHSSRCLWSSGHRR
jgi:hypothetical protein